jgi:hypothetical protein
MEGSGMPYVNTIACFTELDEASRDARLLNLVPWVRITDQRNDTPVEFLPNWSDSDNPDASISIADSTPKIGADPIETIDDLPPALIIGKEPLRSLMILGLSNAPDLVGMPKAIEGPDLPEMEISEQEDLVPEVTIKPPSMSPPWFHIELWCEKTTVNDVLLTIARERQLNVITGPGFQSHTGAYQFLERAKRSRRPVRILYISDFDRSGRNMPLAVARVIEFLNRRDGLDLDIKLLPIALTHEQCIRYELPRTPIKDTDPGKEAFEKRFGEGATELDALEVLHPGALREIILEALDRYRDPTFADRMQDAKESLQQEVDRIRSQVVAPYREELDALAAAPREIIEQRNAELLSFFEVRHTVLHTRIEGIAANAVESINERIAAVQDQADNINAEIEELFGPRIVPINAVIEGLRGEVEALNAEVRRVRAEGIEELNAGIAEQNERCETELLELTGRIERLQRTICESLEPAVGPVMAAAEWPAPEEREEETGAVPLFDSRRDYLGQIEIYKAYQDKPTLGAVAIRQASRREAIRKRLAEFQRERAEWRAKSTEPEVRAVNPAAEVQNR